MMRKISIEVGHGGTDPGAVRGNILEKNINLVVALELQRQLIRHGLNVLMSRTEDVNDRAADFFPRAQNFNPDIGISVHTNAFNGTARGFEVFRNTNSFRESSTRLCKLIETEVKTIGQRSRGVKDSPFLMSSLRCPTAFLELGFLDNPADYTQFDTPAKQRAFGTAYAKGVLNHLGVRWISERASSSESPPAQAPQAPASSAEGTVWRVIAGSFRERRNADLHAAEVRRRGVDCFVAEHKTK
jgi:N-acetylmuramoyl-L-alanine amidase